MVLVILFGLFLLFANCRGEKGAVASICHVSGSQKLEAGDARGRLWADGPGRDSSHSARHWTLETLTRMWARTFVQASEAHGTHLRRTL